MRNGDEDREATCGSWGVEEADVTSDKKTCIGREATVGVGERQQSVKERGNGCLLHSADKTE